MFLLLKVVIPGLHLSLGIFLRLFNMLEDACHELDIKVALALAKEDGKMDSSSFRVHVTNLKQAQRLKAEANELHEVADAHEGTGTVVSCPDWK